MNTERSLDTKSLENIPEDVTIEIKEELRRLEKEPFFTIEGDEVIFDIEKVVKYINMCQESDFNIKEGSSILALQLCFKVIGFPFIPLDGKNTNISLYIKYFQKKHKLTVTGVVNASTLNKIKEEMGKLPSGIRIPITLFSTQQVVQQIEEKIEYDQDGFRNLKESEFRKWFEKDNFFQSGIGDCRLLAGLDALIHYGDYKNLIMNSVRINTQGDFKIYLPLTLKENKSDYNDEKEFSKIPQSDYFKTPSLPQNIKEHTQEKKIIKITSEEYEEQWKQVDVFGKNMQIADTESFGLRALLLAYLKLSQKSQDIDPLKTDGGNELLFIKDMVENINIYTVKNTTMNQGKKHLERMVKQFDPQKHLFCLDITQGETLCERIMLKEFFPPNHTVTVEKTYQKDNIRYVRVSNPGQGDFSYDLPLSTLQQYCTQFSVGSKEPMEEEFLAAPSRKVLRRMWETSGAASYHANSLTDIIQAHGEKNLGLRAKRGVIKIIPQESYENRTTVYDVESYDAITSFCIKPDQLCVDAYLDIKDIKIPIYKLLPYMGKEEKKEYVYGAKIANLINYIYIYYITPLQGASGTPFKINDNHELVFDTINTEILDKIKDRYQGGTRILTDWTQIGISQDDTETQQQVVDHLNALYQHEKERYGNL